MQDHDWNDLKYALALHRTGRLRQAGLRLATSETTVARRIRALETRLNLPLFQRDRTGRYVATEAGQAILRHAETAEHANLAITETAGQTVTALSGIVRLTSVPILLNRILMRHLPALRARHPGITLELVPEARNLDLTRREADLALRLARPATGGHKTRARKIATLPFGLFAPATDPGTQVWIGYDDAHASLPQARWLDTHMIGAAALRVADAATALEAVALGLGKSLLPVAATAGDPRVVISSSGTASPPSRDLWLLSHADPMPRAAVEKVKTWLLGLDWPGSA